MGNSDRLKIPKTVMQNWVYKTFLVKGEKGGYSVFNFRSENGRFIGT